ncbi:MAG TPA: hypothetical protein ENF57_04015, partial [Candidatus Korarchaeota archaeon]|nr:hypothetical protein [Candidatus Korarchaeota archaeon]
LVGSRPLRDLKLGRGTCDLHRFLFPASGLLGAVILLVADTAARTILSPIVLPVGVLTSFLGVPLFLYLMMRRRREYW